MGQALGGSGCHPSQAGLEPTPAQRGAGCSSGWLQSPLGRVSPILWLLGWHRMAGIRGFAGLSQRVGALQALPNPS